MLKPIWMGTNMAAGNQQKHLSVTSWVLLQKREFISCCHVNAASRKSLDIQE